MSPLTKTKTTESVRNYKQYILPAYIVLSALFIIFIAYSYFQSVVYNSWALRWQQQWYDAAFAEVINAVSQWCQSVELNLWEASVNVVNISCIEQAQASPSNTPVESTSAE